MSPVPEFGELPNVIHTFSTREEAAIFSSAMRAEGYFAEILDEGMGAIYGPLAIGGIRVLVSEEPIEKEPEETTDHSSRKPDNGDGEFRQTVRFFTVGLVVLGLIALVLSIFTGFSQQPAIMTRFLAGTFGYVLLLGFVFAVLGPWMGGFTRWLRGERDAGDGGCLRWLFLALITAFLLLMAF